MNSEYQVLARRYRPQYFSDVIGQDAIVTTLQNAIRLKRTAHAYLFSGPRGTGKTTLARLFAKALNCTESDNTEPCNRCSSCREITQGQSLDVIEIDGASNRGIEEIRKINDSVGFAAANGRYRIYIIDEVHMLTKEAFNALLKTLEEPPACVKFFFATTEIHKVLPTIISRCQRFTLKRIAPELIIKKLQSMVEDQGFMITAQALHLIADRADGGMRDAESLLDQILSFHEGEVTEDAVAKVLGVVSSDTFFALDQAGKAGDLSAAFTITQQLFSEGKDLYHFVDSLIEHFRTLLAIQVSGNAVKLHAEVAQHYQTSAKIYSQEQCLGIIDDLIQTQIQLRQIRSIRTALEALLLRILRSHSRVPIDFLISRLTELEATLAATPPTPSSSIPTDCSPPAQQPVIPSQTTVPPPPLSTTPTPPSSSLASIQTPTAVTPEPPQSPSGSSERLQSNPPVIPLQSVTTTPSIQPAIQSKLPISELTETQPAQIAPPVRAPQSPPSNPSQPQVQPQTPPPIAQQQPIATTTKKPPQSSTSPSTKEKPQQNRPPSSKPKPEIPSLPSGKIDTLMQFSAVELGGTLEKKQGTRI